MSDSILTYRNIPMTKISDQELAACSRLYSEHYGVYADDSPYRPGHRVRMGIGWYKEHYIKDDFYIALAEDNGNIIAHAIYLRKKFKNDQTMTWVVQLIVHSDYRSQGIGSKLLHSIWGFSNDFAWGLATSNPFTVKTLEKSTFRKADPKIILKHLTEIKEIGELISFVNDYKVSSTESIVDSRFFVDHSDIEDNIRKTFGTDNWILGRLEPGEEWLAFTFKEQAFSNEYDDSFKELLAFSEAKLQEAYGRMKLKQPWRKHTQEEVDYILANCNILEGGSILDFGCGTGRHAIDFARRGYKVTGIDFSEANIDEARKNCSAANNLNFAQADCREYKHIGEADMVTALYDVVGSFPDESENVRIIKNAFANLKKGGYFVLSVMNLELTMFLAKPENMDNIMANPMALQHLRASKIMQSSGDVFNPDYYFVDDQSGLVYRKEQFADDEGLPAEYIICDKRYTMPELRAELVSCGFVVLDMRFVQAGKWEKKLKGTDKSAKEILVICQKG